MASVTLAGWIIRLSLIYAHTGRKAFGRSLRNADVSNRNCAINKRFTVLKQEWEQENQFNVRMMDFMGEFVEKWLWEFCWKLRFPVNSFICEFELHACVANVLI